MKGSIAPSVLPLDRSQPTVERTTPVRMTVSEAGWHPRGVDVLAGGEIELIWGGPGLSIDSEIYDPSGRLYSLLTDGRITQNPYPILCSGSLYTVKDGTPPGAYEIVVNVNQTVPVRGTINVRRPGSDRGED